MTAETSSRPTPPELKSLDKVVSIPIISESISTIQQTLQDYTPTAYAYGKAVTNSAYSLSTPIQVRLAPLIVSADGYALKGLDKAEERFPGTFTIKTEDVVEGYKVRRDGAVNAITKPVYNIANGVDSSLTPIVDRIEGAVHKMAPSTAPSATSDTADSVTPGETSQVGRLYNLSHQIYNLSSEQLKALQSQNVYIQTATEKVNALSEGLTSYYTTTKGLSVEFVNETKAQAHIYHQNILSELEKIQAATMALPGQVQSRLQPVQEGIRESLVEISTIVKSDVPVGEKVSKVKTAVQERVKPLLEQTSATIQSFIGKSKEEATEANGQVEEKAGDVVDSIKNETSGALEDVKDAKHGYSTQ